MSSFIIQGGVPLHGTVDVRGSKNTALAVLSAIPLSSGIVTLQNVPLVSDTRIKVQLLEAFGVKSKWDGSTVELDARELKQAKLDHDLVQKIRTSFYMLGPLLARLGSVEIPAPGGCKIGDRPVDFHLKGLAALGADVVLHGGTYYGKVDRLVGTEIYLDFPSAGATQHLMSAAALAEGHTTIQNAAMEPEIVSLATFLKGLGARIEGEGTSTVSITGVSQLNGGTFRVPADRMQAGTYLLAGAITRGDVTARGIIPETQTALVQKMREAGADVFEGPDWVRMAAPKRLKGIKIKTMPYPGFATDIQQPTAAVLALAKGNSQIEETIYESRIGHVQELVKMGADITQAGRTTLISGVEVLEGAIVTASDLRAGAALVLAGLAARGETRVDNIVYVDRGYEDFEQTLNMLGGQVQRVGTLSEQPS